VFLSVTLGFYSSEDVIHSVRMPAGRTHKWSFVVSFGSTGLISSNNEVWLSIKLNSAYGVYLNLNLANRTISVHEGRGEYLVWTVLKMRARRHFVMAVGVVRTYSWVFRQFGKVATYIHSMCAKLQQY
jgi:hypothetical protein